MLQNVQAWMQHPFSADMSLGKWVLLVIVIITVAYLWSDVLAILSAGEI